MFYALREMINNMIPGSKGQKAVRACTIKLLNLGPAKYEEVAIYEVNNQSKYIMEAEAYAYRTEI